MLVLDSTSKSITAVLSASPTTNPDFVATYADATSDSFTEAANDGALNGTTEVTLVAAPSSGVRRIVKEIIIYNRNASSVTLTVRYVNGANTRVLWSGTLQPAETWTLSRHVLSMSNWQNIGSGAPTVNDDSTKGYVIGSRWIDITNGQVYVCVDATAGVAVWRNLSSALSASDGNPAAAVYCDASGRLKADYGVDVTGTLTVSSTITASDDIILANDAALQGRMFSLNDDTVLSFNPSNDVGVMLVYNRNDVGITGGLILYRANSAPYCYALVLASNTVTGTGALTNGSNDGIDGKLNVHTHSDGLIYIKNRRGYTIGLGLIFLGN